MALHWRETLQQNFKHIGEEGVDPANSKEQTRDKERMSHLALACVLTQRRRLETFFKLVLARENVEKREKRASCET